MKKKALLVVLAALILVAASVGGTLAYLKVTTSAVQNTFTVGKVGLDIFETGTTNGNKDYKLVPGQDFTKDPKLIVAASSEACYVFVKVEKSSAIDTGALTYSVDNAYWTPLNGYTGVYYHVQAATTSTVDLPILTGNKVTVASTVSQAELNSLIATGDTSAYLKFTGYAIQQANVVKAAADADVYVTAYKLAAGIA